MSLATCQKEIESSLKEGNVSCSVQFSHSVVFNRLQSHGLQHTREHLLGAEEPVVTLCIWSLLSEHWGFSRPEFSRHLPEPWELGHHLPHFADERLSDVKITQLKHG